MYPYSPAAPSNPTSSSSVVVAPDSDAPSAMLLPGQPQSPNAMLFSQSAFTQQKPGYLSPNTTATTISNGGGNGSNVTSNATNGAMLDIMSHSMMQSSNPQAANNNSGSFYCWPPPPTAAVPTAVSRLPHLTQRRSGGGGTGYRISPQNLPSDFSHAQYYFRQQHPQSHQQQPSTHKAGSEAGGYGGGSAKIAGGSTTSSVTSSSSSNWKERPHVGKYSLIRTIGKGNFAKVKLAQHVTTGMEVSHFPFSLLLCCLTSFPCING